ncbi:hypothetical protein CSPX01_00116 [Colletotrichum filicis]|nr:hypothetical protein CSPX01_00116 [Colletotrichum filicis]
MERLRRRKLNLAKKAHEFHRDFQQDFNTDVFLVLASREIGEFHKFDAEKEKMRRDKCLCSDSGVEWVLLKACSWHGTSVVIKEPCGL